MPQFLPVIKLQPFFLLTTSEIPNVRRIRIKKALVVTIFKVHSHLESLAYYCWFYRRLTLGFYHLFYTILNSKCGFASESRHDLENSTKLLPVIQEHPEL